MAFRLVVICLSVACCPLSALSDVSQTETKTGTETPSGFLGLTMATVVYSLHGQGETAAIVAWGRDMVACPMTDTAG